MDYEKLLSELIEDAIKSNASDIHLSAGSRPVLRITGQLLPISKQQILSPKDTAGIAEAMLGKEGFEKFLESREKDFSYSKNFSKPSLPSIASAIPAVSLGD